MGVLVKARLKSSRERLAERKAGEFCVYVWVLEPVEFGLQYYWLPGRLSKSRIYFFCLILLKSHQ